MGGFRQSRERSRDACKAESKAKHALEEEAANLASCATNAEGASHSLACESSRAAQEPLAESKASNSFEKETDTSAGSATDNEGLDIKVSIAQHYHTNVSNIIKASYPNHLNHPN